MTDPWLLIIPAGVEPSEDVVEAVAAFAHAVMPLLGAPLAMVPAELYADQKAFEEMLGEVRGKVDKPGKPGKDKGGG